MRIKFLHAGVFFLILLLIVLQYRLWITDGGLIDMIRLKKQYATLQHENEKLKKRNEELAERVRTFKQDPSYSESCARNELGMIRKDEKFYRVVP